MNRRCRHAPAVFGLLIALGAVVMHQGCAAPVPRREAASMGGFGGDQAASAELVFGGPEWASSADDYGAPEYGRRDYALSPTSNQPILATTEWPEPERASLDNPRYLYIRDRDGRYTYFVPDGYVRRYQAWGWEWGR